MGRLRILHSVNIERLQNKEEKAKDQKSNNLIPSGVTTRSKVPAFDWNKCIFCQKVTAVDPHRVSDLTLSKFIKDNSKFSLRLFIALSTVIDCPARDTYYHLTCLSSFKRFVEKSKKEEKKIDYALLHITEELKVSASKGDVVALDDVWDRYTQFANEYNTISSSSYKDKHTFGICLKSKVKDFY